MAHSNDEIKAGLTSVNRRYCLLRRIGRGGMGEVWEAEDASVDRRVAIKLARHEEDRFDADHWLAAEAQTIVRLSHPALVPLLDRCQVAAPDGSGSRTGLVFDYIEGRPMGLWTDRARPWTWVRGLVEQTLEALAYAHGRGVVHRDFKPSNVLLCGDPLLPTVRLLDFGIATLYSPSRTRDTFGSSVSLVPSDIVPGTRSYMAPEQLAGELGDIGPWSDLYSLGVVVAELLLGRLPFEGSDDNAVWESRLHDRFSPPVQALGELGVPLRRWLLRLLAPDPAQRFGWAADALRALPDKNVSDLTSVGEQRAPSPEATDMLMEVAKRSEERGTDPDASTHIGDGVLTHGSGTLELAPAAVDQVQLPQSWVVDRPAPGAWDEGLRKVPAKEDALIPAGSYGVLSMRNAPLRGRDEEWKNAWNHLRRASEDRKPVMLFVEGPTGRGKTRFARELASVAEEVGVARSHHVRFRVDGSGAGALRRLLERVLRIDRLGDGEREARIQRVLAEAGYPSEADLVPRLVGMLTSGGQGRGAAREEAATAVELFRILGRRRPLLLWLEDIDRSEDQALTHWVRVLMTHAEDLPVAVVATRRNNLKEGVGPMDPDWAVIYSNERTFRLALEPLARDAIADILQVTAGSSAQLGSEIARWSEGDPRAASQTARHLHESGKLRWTPEGFVLAGETAEQRGALKLGSIMAARARDAIEKSADSAATTLVLDLLALVRERAVHGHLIDAGSRLGFEERRLEEALASLVVGELVDVREEGPRLVHGALREHLASRLERTRKGALHRAWANVLEASGRGYGRAERLLEAAWNRAGCDEDAGAARAELEAAHLLRSRWELNAAWRAVSRAVARCADGGARLRAEEEADLQVLSALLEHEVRVPPGTPSELSMALDMLQPCWMVLPPSVERCRAELTHAQALGRAGRPEDAREALQSGLESARAIDSWYWECFSLVGLARDRRLSGRVAEAEELAEQAWKVSQRLGDESLMREVLLARLPIALAHRDLEQSELWLGKLRGFLRNRASWQDLQSLWRFRGEVEWLAGRRLAARHAFETARGLGRERGLTNAPALLSLAAMDLEEGESDLAGLSLAESSAARESGDPHSHEQRAWRAILSAEHSFLCGKSDRGLSALQDAEILMSQFLIASPRGAESLSRSADMAGMDKDIVLRLNLLTQRITDALKVSGANH